MNYKIKFLRPFKDGNIFPHGFAFDETVVVTPLEYEKLKNSGASVEVLGKIVPPHISAEPEAETVTESVPKTRKKNG